MKKTKKPNPVRSAGAVNGWIKRRRNRKQSPLVQMDDGSVLEVVLKIAHLLKPLPASDSKRALEAVRGLLP